MPALADRATNQVDMSGYVPAQTQNNNTHEQPSVSLEPGYNVYLRCPLPPVWSTTSDSLRQYYRNNVIPQTRLFNPPNPGLNSGGSTTNITNIASASSSSGGGTTTIAVMQTSFKTPTINANATFQGSFTLSRAFQLLGLGTSGSCRVRLYGTAAAQSADAYRGLDVPPPAGTAQNIICDVVLDTSPFLWSFQDRVGANADSPVSSTIYVSVTNLDITSDVITLSFTYVPVVS